MKKVLILLLTFILIFTFLTPALGAWAPKHTFGSNLYCNNDYCNITVTFIQSDADYDNEFGYILNGKCIPLGKGHSTYDGKMFTINGFTKGQEIIFYIKTPVGDTFKSGYGIQTKIFKGSNFYKLSFEDVPVNRSDKDYNDIMLKVSGTVGINQEYLNPTIVAKKVANTEYYYNITVTIPAYTNVGLQDVAISPLCSPASKTSFGTIQIPKNKGLSYTTEEQTYTFSNVYITGDKIVSIFTNSTYLNATGYAETFFIVIDVQ